MKASTSCFICGVKIKRQLGFNPAGLNTENSEIFKMLRQSWSDSLFVLLDVTSEKTRVKMNSVPFCFPCHELICDVEFMMSTIFRLESKLQKIKEEVTGSFHLHKRHSPHRHLIQEILSSRSDVNAKVKVTQEITGKLSSDSDLEFHDHESEQEHYDDIGQVKGPILQDEGDAHDPDWTPLEGMNGQGPAQKGHTDWTAVEEMEGQGHEDNDQDWTPVKAKGKRIVKIIRKPRSSPKRSRQNKSSPKRSRRNRSTTVHCQKKSYPCPVCQEVILGYVQYRHPMDVHNPPPPPPEAPPLFSCQYCSIGFRTEEEVKVHQILHVPSTPRQNPFFCVFCPVEMTNRCELQKHVQAEHDERPRALKKFTCDLCGANFKTSECLKKHKTRTHLVGVTKMLQCPQCPYQALYPTMIRAHVLTHGEKLFKCDVENCSSSFYHKKALNQHKVKSHGIGGKTFPCPICTKVYYTVHALKKHETFHSTLRPFMCEICSSTFKSKRNLDTHKQVHAEHKTNRTNLKLQKPRKARLSDIRFQNKATQEFENCEKSTVEMDIDTGPSVGNSDF